MQNKQISSLIVGVVKVLGLSVFSLGTFFLLVGCSRPDVTKTTSTLTFNFDKSGSRIASKVTGLNAELFPVDKKLCYAANVTGTDINQTPLTCGPALGVYGGFVEEGGTLTLEVTKGSSRTVDLYLYTQNLSDPCPTWNSGTLLNPTLLFKIGTATGIDMTADETTVAIDAVFPGTSANLQASLSLPLSCGTDSIPLPSPLPSPLPTTSPSNPSRVSSSGGIATSPSFKLEATVGGPGLNPPYMQTPSGRRLYVQ